MTIKEIFTKHKTEFENAISFYKSDIASIRTGRATPALVEDIKVDAYGQAMTIKELASISTPEPRSIVIQPWDKGVLESISTAIQKSNLGMAPIADGDLIRLNMPALTEERRKEFIKLLKAKSEESKIKIRNVREAVWNEVQKLEKEGTITEDDKFSAKEDLQKTVDGYNHMIEELEKKKEGELLT